MGIRVCVKCVRGVFLWPGELLFRVNRVLSVLTYMWVCGEFCSVLCTYCVLLCVVGSEWCVCAFSCATVCVCVVVSVRALVRVCLCVVP